MESYQGTVSCLLVLLGSKPSHGFTSYERIFQIMIWVVKQGSDVTKKLTLTITYFFTIFRRWRSTL